MSVSEIIEEGLKIHAPSLSVAERDRMVVTALNEVGLDPATRFRYPHEFPAANASASRSPAPWC